jgi:glyoxylase-like metal-dependent hydrolase (beta-lactamase superfamily II)
MSPAPPLPAPTPLVLGDNNVWPLRLHESEGGGWLLIDAGLDYAPDSDDGAAVTSWDVLLEQARAQGIEPGDVRAVLVTHEHIDHAGLAYRWAALGARIIAGRAGLPWLALGAEANERQREPRFTDLRRHGAPDAVIETWRAIRRPRALRWEPCPEGGLVVVTTHLRDT